MNWMDKQVSLYTSHHDVIGRAATFRQILFSEFGDCFSIIYQLRQTEAAYEAGKLDSADYKRKKAGLKSKLPGFAPAALLQQRTAGSVIEIGRSGVMQLDFDYPDIKDYDIEELKQCVFSLPFIGFCSLSCSGKGFFALAMIAEPGRLNEYAERCFEVLLKYGIKVDSSKGKNVNDLRYLSYDANMLIRENPEVLKIEQFKTNTTQKIIKPIVYSKRTFNGENPFLRKGIDALRGVQVGNRWSTVQKVAYFQGKLFKDPNLIFGIRQAIESNGAFAGEEKKYLKCAEDCFKAGLQN